MICVEEHGMYAEFVRAETTRSATIGEEPARGQGYRLRKNRRESSLSPPARSLLTPHRAGTNVIAPAFMQ
jgi:hypothetical protein